MKTVLNNFIVTLKRFKLASALNIFGLSIAFTAFTVILIQVKYDRGFDKFHPKSDRIYRFELTMDSTKYNSLVGRNWGEMIKQHFPQVEAVGLRMAYSPIGDYLKVDRNGSLVGFRETVNIIHPDFLDVFDFEMVEGTKEAFIEPGSIILPQSTATRLFGNVSPVGKPVLFTSFPDTVMTVSGVYKDYPDNTLVKNVIYMALNPDKWGPYDGWQFNYSLYLTLTPSADKEDLSKQILEMAHKTTDIGWIKDYKAVRLVPAPDIYYATDTEYDSDPKGSRAATAVMLGIALLIITIAAINFVNFSTSLVPMRIRSINTQKILGSPVSLLRWTMIGEAVGINLIAVGLSLLWTYLLSMSSFNDLLIAPLKIGGQNTSIIWFTAGIAFVVGLVAGLYPAIYSTSFQPALVLKGSFGLSARGKRLRTALIGFQFIISIALIIAAVFMQIQTGFLRKVNPGYNTEQIAILELNRALRRQQHLVTSKLKESPQVRNVAYSQFLFGTGDAQRNSVTVDEERINFAYFPVTDEFLKVMDIPLTDGRDFLEGESYKIIFNESARKTLRLEAGQVLPYGGQVVGFIGNVNFRSLHHNSQEPFALVFEGTDPNRPFITNLPWTYVKITGDPVTAVSHIKKSISEIDPSFQAEVTFYDTALNNLYQSDRKTTALITLFSLLAVAISLVGVFGLVVFETQYRRKEIGVRKVMGATVSEILAMFNRKFFIIVAVCFILAVPIATYSVVRWLASFAYRTPLHWWVFALAFMAVVAITILTVTIQSWRAAAANPVESLKGE